MRIAAPRVSGRGSLGANGYSLGLSPAARLAPGSGLERSDFVLWPMADPTPPARHRSAH